MAHKVNIVVHQEVQSERLRKDAPSVNIETPNAEKTIAIVYRVSLDPEERLKSAPKRNHYDSFKCFLNKK